MPTPAYMSVTGQKQGNITAGTNTEDSVGNIWVTGHEDEFMVQSFNHTVTVPTDVQSGQPTGQRMHKPLIVTKVFDKSSPLLYTALTTGERLTTVTIKWFRTSKEGIQEHYFTHTLEDGVIVDLRAYMFNCQDPGMKHFTHLEDVAFTYRKIIWEHAVAGTSGEDDWRAPIS